MFVEGLRKLRAPAIALLISGAISGALGVMVSLSGVLRIFIEIGTTPPTDPAGRLGYLAASIVIYGVGVLSIFTSPFVIYGAIQMLNGRKYVFAKFAALLAMIPLTSCFFMVAMPIGLWSLLTLRKPDVKGSFS